MKPVTKAKLCERCGKREANCFLTTIDGGVARSVNLCGVCFDAESPVVRALAETECGYCGEEPCPVGRDFLGLMAESREVPVMCAGCLTRYAEFVGRELKGVGAGAVELSREEQVAVIRGVRERAEVFMRQGSGGSG